jgi:hypothetical protein
MTERVEPPEREIPEFRDVTVENVTATDSEEVVLTATAYEKQPMHNVAFRNVEVEAPTAGSISHARDWTMEDVVFRTDGGEGLPVRTARTSTCLASKRR